MKKIKVIGLLGRSGTGKNTVADNLRVLGGELIHIPILYTSRPRRPAEIDGKDYYFVSYEQAEKDIDAGKAIWASKFNNWYYYLLINSLKEDKINLVLLNPGSACTLDKFWKNEFNIRYFELTLEDKELWRRLNTRPDLNEVARRWPEDIKDFNEPYYKSLPVCRMENTDSQITAYMLLNYIRGMEDAWAEDVKPHSTNPIYLRNTH